ncbi:crossover junction endodeoxyribonuclease RuvC (plasmid) [Rhizobium bangladeshense]|uniref:crossover junction endodeoxyribonuclease RuvC n=1 Tax=Rhizobium bangladeshense TaxID=1138189 RepID=UPI001A98F256|nr:crossover junction endodeoxyribonuclease RuvC [Rhizobium bangladeshense]QSY98692.1 crossover junction endodeoxyribonuclease RuvC [Rhizobium bangladeshense]
MQPVAIRQRYRSVPPMVGAKQIKWMEAAGHDLDNEVWMGIDPSLTATGVGILHRDMLKSFLLTPEIDVPGARPGKTKKEMLMGPARLAWFREQFTTIFETYRPSRLAIEGYSYGSKNGREALGELGGVLRLAAHDCRLTTIIAPPNTLKQFATGKGNVGKGVIIKEAFKRWNIDVSDDNEADAAVLSLMANAHATDAPLTAFQVAAMSKVEVMRQ